MSSRLKLFFHRTLYDCGATQALFLRAMREALLLHRAGSEDYARILERARFSPDDINSPRDLAMIPAIPTLFLKKHPLFCVPYERLPFQVESSGTSGAPSRAGLDLKSCLYALRIVERTFSYHNIFSIRPVNYVMLGYEPARHNRTGAVKTAYGASLAAPALHRTYALKDTGSGYQLNLDGVKDALVRYEKAGHPVRLIGFPSFLLALLESLRDSGIRLTLPSGSMVLLAGGWKRFEFKKIEKPVLFAFSQEMLGIGEAGFRDFFGAVEHPISYCACKSHRFHVPTFARVLIRDVKTLEPVPYGTSGLLNLISPLVGSMAAASILTDDLAVLGSGEACGCGIKTPYFELLGRAGGEQVKTCAAGAGELLGGPIL